MVRSTATTVDEYLAELTDDRRDAIEEVRETILEHLPEGFVESMNWGMIAYEVPLGTFPDTYNGQPLMYAALASQKNHMAVYLTTVYADGEIDSWFRERYEATGKKLDMGKSCVRFKKLEQLPVELIGEVISRTTLEEFVARYGESMKKRR
ncbi:MAG: iron chaperone [Acidimicrobiales bacterium]